MKTKKKTHSPSPLAKSQTGIQGFDTVTLGGLPKHRTSLLCGGPGCGKTLFAMEYLVKGILEFNEPGVFVCFEENKEELIENFNSLGYDLKQLIAQKKLAIEYIRVDKREIEETGEYDLEGLFIRLNNAIRTVKAKRVALDTIETLFAGFTDEAILRAELRRLFHWMKAQKVTSILTAERGDNTLTRYGLEEYVSDCVIFLDHRITSQLSTRRLRIVKYRGSLHGTNEYPFLIDKGGLSVLPITSVGLDYKVTTERISSGVPDLDLMFDGKGYFRGSTILFSGTAGTGKTSMAASFANETCKSGKKCLYFAFEESASQIVRNMDSIGLNLATWEKKGLLKFHTVRPTIYSLEMHLVMLNKMIEEYEPEVVILDPISNLITQGDSGEVKSMLLRIIDVLKLQNVTTLLTNLTSKNEDFEHIEINVSSIADTWVFLREVEVGGELRRGMYVIKSRGMPHSNKIKEFSITSQGLRLTDGSQLA